MDPLNESKIDNHRYALQPAVTMRKKSSAPNARDPCTLCAQICRCIYQLHLFFTKNYREFVCVNCIKVPKEFQDLFKKQGENMIDTYKREVGACENILMVQKDNESKLINGIKKMKEKEKNNIQRKDLIDLIEHKFKQLEGKLHDTLNDRVKYVKRADQQGAKKRNLCQRHQRKSCSRF